MRACSIAAATKIDRIEERTAATAGAVQISVASGSGCGSRLPTAVHTSTVCMSIHCATGSATCATLPEGAIPRQCKAPAVASIATAKPGRKRKHKHQLGKPSFRKQTYCGLVVGQGQSTILIIFSVY